MLARSAAPAQPREFAFPARLTRLDQGERGSKCLQRTDHAAIAIRVLAFSDHRARRVRHRRATGMRVDDEVRHGQQCCFKKMRQHGGRRAVRIAREQVVEVEVIDRRQPGARLCRGVVHRRQDDQSAANVVRLKAPG